MGYSDNITNKLRNGKLKTRKRVLEDVILKLKGFFTTDGLTIDAAASNIATESTAASMNLSLLNTVLELQGVTTELETINTVLAGKVESVAKTTVVASGTVAAGYKSVAMLTSEDFTGTILGDTASPSTMYSFTVTNMENTLDAIPYTIGLGSIEIVTSVIGT